jgi:Reverse transcriptase (RNA-dependent DNA polymerase)
VHRLICRGHTDAVDADLSRYFDSIPHGERLKSVAGRIVGRHMLRLIKLWLKAPIEERDDGDGTRRIGGGKSNARGTPQGGVASPLLANIYMNRFLKHWGRGGVQGTRHRVCRRLRHPQYRMCGRGPGVGEGGDDAARTDTQRGQDRAHPRLYRNGPVMSAVWLLSGKADIAVASADFRVRPQADMGRVEIRSAATSANAL